ncbi:MAG: phosphate ABC transporter substrate-binding protein PstS [Burkholderiales bacterium]|nr:phosphate ABC transporter substrate-binding protein PstS [Burkholderiales bacterium]
MSRLFVFCIASLLLPQSHARALDLNGTGSSAAKPLYLKWAETYTQQGTIKLNYQANGSAEGLKQIKARAADFGASDVPLTAEELKRDKLISFPSAISGIVPVFNLPDVKSGELRFSGEVLADIFARKITMWNDPALAALNPGVALPKKAITLIVRQDGSGTSYNFTDYLSQVSPNWKVNYGHNFTVKWPQEAVQVKGTTEVINTLKQTAGAISYVDFKFVGQEKLTYGLMKNRDGKFVAPSAKAFASALNNSPWRSSGAFEESLSNRPGSSSWPITAGTFVVLPQSTNNPANTIAMLKFFSWAFVKGDHLADSADFVALPDSVQARIFVELLKITDAKGKPLEWTPM